MLIYRHWVIMVYSEKLLHIIALMKCEDYHTQKAKYRFCLIIAYTKTRAITQVLWVDFDETYRILRVHGTYHLYQE